MSYPYLMLVTEVTGNTLSATDYNNEHQNHINNNIPSSIGGDSANVAGMQTTVTPGGVGTESLASDLKGEIERLRYMFTATHGEAQWYVSPGTTLKAAVTYITGLVKYRRPNLAFISTTVVGIDTGLDGTSGDGVIMFTDGSVRTDTDTTRIRMTISQNAVFNSSTRANNVGGLRTGSATSNTWYAVYAVKVSAGSGVSTDWVLVADTVTPIQSNYATLNTNFGGANSWVYLGMIRYGNGQGSSTVILDFRQTGNLTIFRNTVTVSAVSVAANGVQMASNGGATSVSWAPTAGTGNTSVPDTLITGYVTGLASATANDTVTLTDSGSTFIYGQIADPNSTKIVLPSGRPVTLLDGAKIANSNSVALNIVLTGFCDSALGVGSNPLL